MAGFSRVKPAHDERESTEKLLLYIFYMYLDLGQSAIIDKKDVAEAGAVSCGRRRE
jgi:hypothetical protein